MSIETTVHYVVHYRYPWDYDDDSPSGIGDHTLQWDDSSKAIEATTDDEARLASLAEEFRRPRSGRNFSEYESFVTKIVKHVHEETDDGFVRDTEFEVTLPSARRCPCGQTYWPIKGEKACHILEYVSPRLVPRDS